MTQDPVEIVDKFLMSDRAPENSMGISDLDGFLTGIVIGPELIMPSEWLPHVWGGKFPELRDDNEAQSVMEALMQWYNEIVRGFQQTPPEFEPIIWQTRDGIVIAADWAEGFRDAINLRPILWKPLLDDAKESRFLKSIRMLCGEHRDDASPSEHDIEMMEQAADKLPASVVAIHEFWKRRRART